MKDLESFLAGEAYSFKPVETSSDRLLVINRETKQSWINVTLACSDCPACQSRIAMVDDPAQLFEVEIITALVGFKWLEVPYVKVGEDWPEMIFTVESIQTLPLGLMSSAVIEGSKLCFELKL